MAWPDDLGQVQCVGFDRSLLPFLQNAIDNGRVKFGGTSMFAELAVSTFDYLGFRYELEETTELVTAIRKIAKIDEDEDGNELVLEDYAFDRKREQYGSAWGGF